MTSLQGLRYGVNDVPPLYLAVIMGFQHYLTMFGGTFANALIIIPFLCVDDPVARSEIISSLFFVSGIVTLVQATFGVRLPIIQGGTFALVGPIIAIMSLEKWKCPVASDQLSTTYAVNATTSGPVNEGEGWKLRMREVQGAIICASLVQMVIGVTGVIGVMLRFIGPLTIAPTITLIGLSLFHAAADFCAKQWAVAVVTIVLVTLFSQYVRHLEVPCVSCSKGKQYNIVGFRIFELFPIILAVIIIWFICFVWTVTGGFKDDPNDAWYGARTDKNIDVLYDSKWFRLPYPGQWGLPTVSVAAWLGVTSGVIAGILESIGDYYACARLCGAPPPPTHAINRGIFIEGVGTMLAGLFGTSSGTTSYSENIGAIGITKIGSLRVTQFSGCIMIILGMLGKFGAVFVTIPVPIVGGILMVMFGMVTAVGISNLQFVDLNSARNLFIVGFSIFVGLSVPVWLGDNRDFIKIGIDTLDEIIYVLLTTGMFIGGLLGFILDNTIPGTKEERGITKMSKSRTTEQNQEVTQSETSDEQFYQFPWPFTDLVHKVSWFRYIPICTSFQGWSLRCPKCRDNDLCTKVFGRAQVSDSDLHVNEMQDIQQTLQTVSEFESCQQLKDEHASQSGNTNIAYAGDAVEMRDQESRI